MSGIASFAARIGLSLEISAAGTRPGAFDIVLRRPDGRHFTLANAMFYERGAKRPSVRPPHLEEVLASLAPAYGDLPEETARIVAFFGDEYDAFVALMASDSAAA